MQSAHSKPKYESPYILQGSIGEGSYGVVYKAFHRETGKPAAAKNLTRIFESFKTAKAALREIKLYRLLGAHPNFIGLKHIDMPKSLEKFKDLNLYLSLGETDIRKALKRPQSYYGDEHVQWIIFQILNGINYLHSLQILHRDIKSSNILVNSDCSIQICDLSLARAIGRDNRFKDPEQKETVILPPAESLLEREFTKYVTTRNYRSPEVILKMPYSYPTDMWGVGCILGELLIKLLDSFTIPTPLFPGRYCEPFTNYNMGDYSEDEDQLRKIFHLIGSPTETELNSINNVIMYNYAKFMPQEPRKDFHKMFPNANPAAIDLLSKLLVFDPNKRITAADALKHDYFKNIPESKKIKLPQPIPLTPEDKELINEYFNFEATKRNTKNQIDEIRNLIIKEINYFNKSAPIAEIKQNNNASSVANVQQFNSYILLDNSNLPSYLKKLGQPFDANKMEISNLSDGNLNFVFRIKNLETQESFILKQAPPFFKCFGNGVELSTERMKYEIAYYKQVQPYVSNYIPKLIYTDDRNMMCIQMEDLKSHTVMRQALMENKNIGEYENNLANYLAQALFHTSKYYLSAAQREDLVKNFNSNTLCDLTMNFIFTFPFMQHESNYLNINFPQTFKNNAEYFKKKFAIETEALLHGDLHTGSIMINGSDIKIIDPEFSFVGPMGFDIGILVANLITSWVSQITHFQKSTNALDSAQKIINLFSDNFVHLLQTKHTASYSIQLAFEFLEEKVFKDAVAFAGLEICRRIVGKADAKEIRGIENAVSRKKAEDLCLFIGTQLVENYKTINLKNIKNEIITMQLKFYKDKSSNLTTTLQNNRSPLHTAPKQPNTNLQTNLEEKTIKLQMHN